MQPLGTSCHLQLHAVLLTTAYIRVIYPPVSEYFYDGNNKIIVHISQPFSALLGYWLVTKNM